MPSVVGIVVAEAPWMLDRVEPVGNKKVKVHGMARVPYGLPSEAGALVKLNVPWCPPWFKPAV